MAEQNQSGSLRDAVRLEFNGIKIECYLDGTFMIFADPERFNITTRAGRGDGKSGRLYSCVVIAPYLAPHTSGITPNSQPTQITN